MTIARRLTGLLALLAVAYATAREAQAQRYLRDPIGRVTQEIYENGTTISYTYDEWGNVTSREVTSSPPDDPGDPGGGGGGGGGGICGATAVYGSPHARELEPLRAFRERWLRPTRPGRALIDVYERLSRSAVPWLERSALLRGLARLVLDPLVFVLQHPGVLLLAAASLLLHRIRTRRSAIGRGAAGVAAAQVQVTA